MDFERGPPHSLQAIFGQNKAAQSFFGVANILQPGFNGGRYVTCGRMRRDLPHRLKFKRVQFWRQDLVHTPVCVRTGAVFWFVTAGLSGPPCFWSYSLENNGLAHFRPAHRIGRTMVINHAGFVGGAEILSFSSVQVWASAELAVYIAIGRECGCA